MESCLCAYLPKEDTETEKNEIFQTTDTVEENEGIDQRNETVKDSRECDMAILQLFEEDFSLNEKINEFEEFNNSASSVSIDSISASQVLVVQARNWQLKHEFAETEDTIKCLQQSLQEQWSKRNKISYEILRINEEKTKLLNEMQNKFSEHVTERNKLILEITQVRQKNMRTMQHIIAAETKNRQLKNERNETAECVYKTSVQLYNNRTSGHPPRHRNSLSDINSESESQATDTTSVNSSISSISDEAETEAELTTACSTVDSSTSVECAPNTSELDETSDVESTSSKLKNESTALLSLEPTKPSNEIRLDFSFAEKAVLQNVDSGFSDVTNIATQSSTNTIRIINANTPNILE